MLLASEPKCLELLIMTGLVSMLIGWPGPQLHSLSFCPSACRRSWNMFWDSLGAVQWNSANVGNNSSECTLSWLGQNQSSKSWFRITFTKRISSAFAALILDEKRWRQLLWSCVESHDLHYKSDIDRIDVTISTLKIKGGTEDVATTPVSHPAGVPWQEKTHTACCSAVS